MSLPKLYRFDYSNYCRKVQMALDLVGRRYEIVEVPYGDRTELLSVTGDSLSVPVWVETDGRVVRDSRAICAHLASSPGGERLVPEALAGPVWALADFCDGPLEDILFRIATPGIRRRFVRQANRVLFTLLKERRYGAGCVDSWEREQSALLARAREALGPTLTTLGKARFLLGSEPTLADAALYGQLAMVEVAGRDVATLGAPLRGWLEALQAFAGRTSQAAH